MSTAFRLSACAAFSVLFLFLGNICTARAYVSDAQMLEAFSETAWYVECNGCNRSTTGRDFTPYYMYLSYDMRVGYSYNGVANFDFTSSPADWMVNNATLIIRWQNGDVEKYFVHSLDQDAFPGVNQYGIEQIMTFMRTF